MAVNGEGLWFNPISGEYDTINGVYCSCYDCVRDSEIYADNVHQHRGSWFFSKNEFKAHRLDRFEAYIKFEKELADKKVRTMLRTWETDGAGDQVELSSKPPTYFDISHRSGVLARWSIRNRSKNYAFRDE